MSSDNSAYLLILEDDLDQMNFIVDIARDEVRRLVRDQNLSERQKDIVRNIGVIEVSNILELQKAASAYDNILLALLDCNIPDTPNSAPHDQLLKTNHSITGQHRSVDIVTQYLPEVPITLMSSLDRFRRLVSRYYERKHDLSINFVSKSDPVKMRENFQFYLKEYLASID